MEDDGGLPEDDEWDDPEGDWPAERIDQLNGGPFGNSADYLWRCRLCSGYFVAKDPVRSASVIVGLIPYELSPDQQRKQEAERLARATGFLAEKTCTCDFHRRPLRGFFW